MTWKALWPVQDLHKLITCTNQEQQDNKDNECESEASYFGINDFKAPMINHSYCGLIYFVYSFYRTTKNKLKLHVLYFSDRRDYHHVFYKKRPSF